jgi:hypothetical protein
MGYRETWFAHNKGIRLPFKRGVQYRCVRCGGFFPKSKIEIDHRIPKRHGGTDDLWNLQPMCRTCNRSKNANQTSFETAGTLVRATMHGDLGTAIGGIAGRKVKDALGIKYKRR